MKKRLYSFWLVVLFMLVSEGSLVNVASAHALVGRGQGAGSRLGAAQGMHYHRACQVVIKGALASCNALVVGPVPAPQRPGGSQATAPGGGPPYTPQEVGTAYHLSITAATTQTIAIVDAYDDPNAESDLAQYRSTFGLTACTSASGCFRKVNQNGAASPLPTADIGWGQEISLDLDMVSAVCQNCHILLIETNSAGLLDLGTGVNRAITMGSVVVSNSYGTNGEFNGEQTYCDMFFSHNNAAIVASAGDTGPGISIPAACGTVIGVGGTTLNSDGSESAWSSSGGGCSSTALSKPGWQGFVSTGCANRAVPDVSALGNPYTGIYAYDSYGLSGWYEMGGTSASAPLIAGVYALAGNAGGVTNPVTLPWQIENESFECLNDVPGLETTEYAYQTGLGSPINTYCF